MDRRRRTVVKGLTAVAFTPLAASKINGAESLTTKETESPPGPTDRLPVAFNHGVASGDPLSDRVILWTRVTPTEDLPRNIDAISVSVTVALDRDMHSVVQRLRATTGPQHDFCVKLDVRELNPNTWYYYQFSVGRQRSPVGRTRTFPATGQRAERARFAVVSCSNYAFGLFSVYSAVKQQADLDFVLHLGDYLYEYGPGEYGDYPGREPVPARETVTLDDYRQRHGQYKTDSELQSVHQQFPMICVWDDHESADNSYRDGAGNHTEATEGSWSKRKAAAVRAYFEWMPIRSFPFEHARLWRRFAFGDLIDLFMLDTRLEGRDLQAPSPVSAERFRKDRHLISEAQMTWLTDGLVTSEAKWRMVGQQVMLSELNVARTLDTARLLGLQDEVAFNGQLVSLNVDQWDGYVADRNSILQTLASNLIDNTVVFTGDIHTSWANEIYASDSQTGRLAEGPLAAEFITPSVTSPGFPEELAPIGEAAIPLANPHIKYLELTSPGFILVDVSQEQTQAEYLYVRTISSQDQLGQIDEAKTKVVGVNSGSSRIYEDRPRTRPRTIRTALLNPLVAL